VEEGKEKGWGREGKGREGRERGKEMTRKAERKGREPQRASFTKSLITFQIVPSPLARIVVCLSRH